MRSLTLVISAHNSKGRSLFPITVNCDYPPLRDRSMFMYQVRINKDVRRLSLSKLRTFCNVDVRLSGGIQVNVTSFCSHAKGVVNLFHRILHSRGLFANLSSTNVVSVRILGRRPNASTVIYRLTSLLNRLRSMVIRRGPYLMLKIKDPVTETPNPMLYVAIIFNFQRSIFNHFSDSANLGPDPRNCFTPI